ncbi:MAG: hypothetical protein AAF604_05965 [Acidobacteriota bacterium]
MDQGKLLRWGALLVILLSLLVTPGTEAQEEPLGFGDKTCFCWVGLEGDDEKLLPLKTDLVFPGPFNESEKKRKCSKRCSELCRDAFGDTQNLCEQFGRPMSPDEVDRLGCFSVVGADDNDNNKWDYDGRPCAGFEGCTVECDCPPGTWYDPNRGSCVRGACPVPGMPNGDKGGGFFAWQGQLYQDVAGARNCRTTPLCTGGCDEEPEEEEEVVPLTATATSDSQLGCDRMGAFNGEVTVKAQGGTAPYELSGPRSEQATETGPGTWTIIGIEIGTHTYVVTDATGAKRSVEVTVEDPRPRLEVVDIQPPSCCYCNDGSATATAQGNGPFTYRWQPTDIQLYEAQATTLPSGEHQITVFDDLGCQTVKTVTIPVPEGCPTESDDPGTAPGEGEPSQSDDSPLWRLGRLETGRTYPTSVTARNANCRGRRDFTVRAVDTPWLRIVGSDRLQGIKRGREKSTEAEIDLRDVLPGEYRGLLLVECVDCPANCRQDRQEIEVTVEAVAGEGYF